MNYTRFALKDQDKIASALEGRDNLFLIACNKCFKTYDTLHEPEVETVREFAASLGKKVLGSVNLDFLCNSVQTERRLADAVPEGTETIVVISCGLGVQTIAAKAGCPVVAAADTLNYRGHHGMALTDRTCGACAQCYLNLTGGICPVVDCAKSLLNGQCGGSKDGKCEVDGSKDCAWQKIYERLSAQGRLKEFLAQPVQLRDYSKADRRTVAAYVKKARESRLTGYYGGIHPSENKDLAENLPLVKFPEPETVVIPLSMHVGKPATPVVRVGDTVKVGQKIAEASGFISSHIHSSVSGTVVAIEPHLHPNRGVPVDSIVIRSDKKDTLDPSVKPAGKLEDLTPDEIVSLVQEKGITGMGGAGFPTFVKLKPNKPIDAVLLNGCECEPYLAADNRVLLEYPDDVVYGMKAIMKAVGAPKGYIVIEDNKPEAAKLIAEKAAECGNIEVRTVRTKYPQGAEKMLIKNIMHRQVPSGGLPADVGAVVDNVSTAKAIADAIRTGMPLIERVVSVTGERIRRPGNFVVRIGTSVKEIIDYCGGIVGDDVTVKMGGPMMGSPLTDTDVPVIKGSNGILAVGTDHTVEEECIKCGRCVDVCPMELEPLNFAKLADAGDAEALQSIHIMDCFECGCCQYICSSKIPLVTKIRAGKSLERGLKK